MPTEPQAAEAIRAAISALTLADILRLRFAAIAFDRHRHEDLLQEAISRSLSGERQWREGVPIYWHLHEVMRSIAWNWHKKFDENLVLASQFESDDERGFIGEMTEPTPDPERQAAARLMLGRLVETCGSDRIVLGIISGKLQGKTGSEIREELNLDERDFNAAAQRLRRSAKALVRGRRYA